MNDMASQLIVKVSNDKTYFEIVSEDEVTIEDIKNKCKEEFNYSDEEIKKINIWFIDEENDKNLICDNNMIKENAQEIDDLKFLINLKVDINDNIVNENYNNINLLEKEKRKSINDKDKTNFIKEQKRIHDEKINKLKKKN